MKLSECRQRGDAPYVIWRWHVLLFSRRGTWGGVISRGYVGTEKLSKRKPPWVRRSSSSYSSLSTSIWLTFMSSSRARSGASCTSFSGSEGWEQFRIVSMVCIIRVDIGGSWTSNLLEKPKLSVVCRSCTEDLTFKVWTVRLNWVCFRYSMFDK